MSNPKYIFPSFDTLELQPQLEFKTTSYTPLHPVKTGSILDGRLNHLLSNYNSYLGKNALSYNTDNFKLRFDKILVVYFYSKAWGNISLEHLKQLHDIRHEVRYQDGNLLVVDADGDRSTLQETLWANGLSLQVHKDIDNQIAKLFKVYAGESPAWNYYPGIEENIPLPATFVVDHSLQVVFGHSNQDLSVQLPTEQIVGKVYQTNNYLARSKSA
jgi:peroxiredoxin